MADYTHPLANQAQLQPRGLQLAQTPSLTILLGELHEQLHQLAGMVEQLAGKLEPVLGPDRIAKATVSPTDQPPTTSSVVDSLLSAQRQITIQIQELRRLYDRLEV